MRPEQMNIFLADDDKDDCLLFREALEELPLQAQLTTVHDGDQLMDLLSKNLHALPDMLFLDLNMPRKNGYQCLEEIKNNKQLDQLPITIYSTFYEPSIANKLYKNGVRYYICKAPDFVQLKRIIHIALRLIKKQPGSLPDKDVFLLNDLEKKLFIQ